MWRYIGRRLLMIIPVILGVTALVFTIMQFLPGDPAVTLLGTEAEQSAIDALREELGLNDPFIVRLGRYFFQVFFKFDLGNSIMSGVPVLQELSARFPVTLMLTVIGIVISIVVGIPLGINAAIHQNQFADYFSMIVALFGVSMPSFWVALMLVLIFSARLGWLPPYGMGGIEYWILPIFSSCVRSIATQARQSRSSMLEVINSDYIVMARAKGLRERKVIYRHALPNALIPLITIAGMNFGASLGGGMVIETIFSIPGVGYYMIRAISNRDYTVVQSCVLVLALLYTLIMLVTDLIMAAVDPRIKSQFFGSKRRKKNV